MRKLAVLVDIITSHIVPGEDKVVKVQHPDIIDDVEEAKRDWLLACAHFDNVTDPELVDHAIYLMEAAQKRYIYMLRRAREEKVTHPFEP